MSKASEALKARARADAPAQRETEPTAARPADAARRRVKAAEENGETGTFADREAVAEDAALKAGVKLREREAAADRIRTGAPLARERPLTEPEAAEVAAAREILAEAVERAVKSGNDRAARRWQTVLDTPAVLPAARWDAAAVVKLTELAARQAVDRFNGRHRAGWQRDDRADRAEELASRLAVDWLSKAADAGQAHGLPLQERDWQSTRAWLAVRAEGWLKDEAAELAETDGRAEDLADTDAAAVALADAVSDATVRAADLGGYLAAAGRPLGKAEAEGLRATLDGLTHRERAAATGETLAVVKNRAARGRRALAARWPNPADGTLRADLRHAFTAVDRDALADAAEVQGLPAGFIRRVERATAAAAATRRMAGERPNGADALPAAMIGAGPRRWNRAAADRRRVGRVAVRPVLNGPASLPWQGFRWEAERDESRDRIAREAEAARRARARWTTNAAADLTRLQRVALAEVQAEGLRAAPTAVSRYVRPVPTVVGALPQHPAPPPLPARPVRLRVPNRGGRPAARFHGPPRRVIRLPWADTAVNPHPAGHGRLDAEEPKGCGPVSMPDPLPNALPGHGRTRPRPLLASPWPRRP